MLLCWRCPPLHSRTLISFYFIIIMFLESLILPYIFPVCCAMKYFNFSDRTLSVSFSHHIPLPRYPFIRFPTLPSSSSSVIRPSSSPIVIHPLLSVLFLLPLFVILRSLSPPIFHLRPAFLLVLPALRRALAGDRVCLNFGFRFGASKKAPRVDFQVLLICFPFRNFADFFSNLF